MTVLQVWRSVCSLERPLLIVPLQQGFSESLSLCSSQTWCWWNRGCQKCWCDWRALSTALLDSAFVWTCWWSPGAPALAALCWICLMHTTSSSHPCSQERAHCIILSLSYTGKQKRRWGGIHRWKSWQEHLSRAVLQHWDSASVSHVSLLALKTASVVGLALHNSNHCHQSPFGVTGFDLLLAAQSRAASLKVWGSLGMVSEQLSMERSFIPKGIFSDFIEKALVCCCCFPKNYLKIFGIWKLSCYDQTDKSHG